MTTMANIEQLLRAQQERIAQLEATQFRHLRSLLELQKFQTQISELQTWSHDQEIATRQKKLELQYKDLFDQLCREAAGPTVLPIATLPTSPRSSPPRHSVSLPSPTSLAPETHTKSYTGSPLAAVLPGPTTPTPSRGSKRPRAPSPIPEEEEQEEEEIKESPRTLRARKAINYYIKPADAASVEDESSSSGFVQEDHDKLVDYMVAPHRARNGGVDWNYFATRNPRHAKGGWFSYYQRHKKEIDAAAEDKAAED